MVAGSHIGFYMGNISYIDYPQSVIVCLSFAFKFRLDWIYSFGDIAFVRFHS